MGAIVVIPAIDILGGHCVRLVQGDYAHPDRLLRRSRLRSRPSSRRPAPSSLHVVDLDAARGTGDNKP